MSYQVLFTPRAEREFKSLPEAARRRIAPRIDALAEEPRPRGIKKLQGREGTYRLRVGDYRVLYTIEDRVVTVVVVRIGHRRDIYA